MTTKTKVRENKPTNRGQALIEFAMVVPLLAILLFGIIQYGFIFSAYMTLRHSAHQTARTLSLPNSDTNAANAYLIASRAITPLTSANLGTPTVSVATVSKANDSISVQLSYGLPLIIRYVVPNAVGNTLTLTAQATYRTE